MWMLEVAVWSIQPDMREMGTPEEAISPATEHALICTEYSLALQYTIRGASHHTLLAYAAVQK